MSASGNSTLKVIARAPFNIHYDGQADAVTATNAVGTFDIMPGHADFFSMLEPCEVAIATKDEVVTFPISNGMIVVRDDEVELYVNV